MSQTSETTHQKPATVFDVSLELLELRDPVYVHVSATEGDVKAQFEYYESASQVILLHQATDSFGSKKQAWLWKKEEGKVYTVNIKEQNLMDEGLTQLPLDDDIQPYLAVMDGKPREGTVTVKGKEYQTKYYTVSEEAGAYWHYVREQNDLIAFVIQRPSSSQREGQVVLNVEQISNEIPSNSLLAQIQNYELYRGLQYLCRSASMSPALQVGEYYYFTPVADASQLQVGDIVLVNYKLDTAERMQVAHRIHEIKAVDGTPSFILKGDQNHLPDQEEYRTEDILGVLIS